MRTLALSITRRPLGVSRRQHVINILCAGLFAAFMMLQPSVANAQTPSPTPAPYDISSFTTAAETKLYSNLGVIMPMFIGVFLTMLGIGMVVKWTKRGAKTS